MLSHIFVIYTTVSILISVCESRNLLGDSDKPSTNNESSCGVELPVQHAEDNSDTFIWFSKTNTSRLNNPTDPSIKKMLSIKKNPSQNDSHLVIIIPNILDEYARDGLGRLQTEKYDDANIRDADLNFFITERSLKPVFFSTKHKSLALKDINGVVTPLEFSSSTNTYSERPSFQTDDQNVRTEITMQDPLKNSPETNINTADKINMTPSHPCKLNSNGSDTTTLPFQNNSESSLAVTNETIIPTKNLTERKPNQTIEATARPILSYKSNTDGNDEITVPVSSLSKQSFETSTTETYEANTPTSYSDPNHCQINTPVTNKTLEASFTSSKSIEPNMIVTDKSTGRTLLPTQSSEVNTVTTDAIITQIPRLPLESTKTNTTATDVTYSQPRTCETKTPIENNKAIPQVRVLSTNITTTPVSHLHPQSLEANTSATDLRSAAIQNYSEPITDARNVTKMLISHSSTKSSALNTTATNTLTKTQPGLHTEPLKTNTSAANTTTVTLQNSCETIASTTNVTHFQVSFLPPQSYELNGTATCSTKTKVSSSNSNSFEVTENESNPTSVPAQHSLVTVASRNYSIPNTTVTDEETTLHLKSTELTTTATDEEISLPKSTERTATVADDISSQSKYAVSNTTDSETTPLSNCFEPNTTYLGITVHRESNGKTATDDVASRLKSTNQTTTAADKTSLQSKFTVSNATITYEGTMQHPKSKEPGSTENDGKTIHFIFSHSSEVTTYALHSISTARNTTTTDESSVLPPQSTVLDTTSTDEELKPETPPATYSERDSVTTEQTTKSASEEVGGTSKDDVLVTSLIDNIPPQSTEFGTTSTDETSTAQTATTTDSNQDIVTTDQLYKPESAEVGRTSEDILVTSFISTIPPQLTELDATSTDEETTPENLTVKSCEQEIVTTDQTIKPEAGTTSKDILVPSLLDQSMSDSTKPQSEIFDLSYLNEPPSPVSAGGTSEDINNRDVLSTQHDNSAPHKDIHGYTKLQDIQYNTELLFFNAAQQFSTLFRKLYSKMADVQKKNSE